ncbi:hypothetical protein GWI33_011598 [Rhynchophorus ferrugineus]|uniref:Uncharacterized protein n=1 Tax=Rhynchophorus ferrugineus TaxID=354439 RepID=A0A834ICJ8_RHYFE|nr:hypothetical protein GWI33_011598 [Rhynchophorus ferrugineus]
MGLNYSGVPCCTPEGFELTRNSYKEYLRPCQNDSSSSKLSKSSEAKDALLDKDSNEVQENLLTYWQLRKRQLLWYAVLVIANKLKTNSKDEYSCFKDYIENVMEQNGFFMM